MTERSTILWRRLDLPGHEVAALVREATRPVLSGIVLVAHDGRPCRLEYRIECDDEWRTRIVGIHGQLGDAPVSLELFRSEKGAWVVNQVLASHLQGCVDVDLGFSPSTNLLPIRRLGLAVGKSTAVRAAWVRFPQLTVEVLEQTYTRASERTYVYESAGGSFRRELTVNDAGFVTEYPELWRAEAFVAREDTHR